MNNLNI